MTGLTDSRSTVLCADGTQKHWWLVGPTEDGFTHDSVCKYCHIERTFSPYAQEEEGGRAASIRTHTSLAGTRPTAERSWVTKKGARPS